MTAASPSADLLLGEINAATEETVLCGAINRAQHAIAADRRSEVPALTAAWSAVLCHGVAAGLRLMPGSAEWTWFASGSVARREAVLGSDVETMVVLDDRISDGDKADLLRRAADVHALLERCGIYGDANGVMASRPRFCRRAASWSKGIEQWTAEPHRDRGVVMTGLMADSAGLPGAAGLAGDALRRQVASAASRNYPVRQAMLQDATAMRASVPSRLRVLTRNADSVDVKLAVMDPVVKIARWAALSSGSDALCTPARLDAAIDADVLDADDAVTLQGCFEWLLGFRWRTRAAGFLAGRPAADVVSLAELAPQERAALRSVAREVSGISRKLNFLASTSAYR
ncbi:putative nucleotidyltransferase substrate binding domain-containing protein [Mycolicibacterium sphagni]|uniref:Signal transduction protein n=1 Tax=Mycolicibacterium sphagni TaxID=1786 RepID=A0ABX2JU51_9MYCO|nr:putative nucleotidyltransferase substrate binding domain-containing protein [Mycolicibacterium sphagni]NTY58411.1 hypothetical protein [Mycolicibacterium sphagni]